LTYSYILRENLTLITCVDAYKMYVKEIQKKLKIEIMVMGTTISPSKSNYDR